MIVQAARRRKGLDCCFKAWHAAFDARHTVFYCTRGLAPEALARIRAGLPSAQGQSNRLWHAIEDAWMHAVRPPYLEGDLTPSVNYVVINPIHALHDPQVALLSPHQR